MRMNQLMFAGRRSGTHLAYNVIIFLFCFFFQAEDGIRDDLVTGVQTCALPICMASGARRARQARSGRLAGGWGMLLRVRFMLLSPVVVVAESARRNAAPWERREWWARGNGRKRLGALRFRCPGGPGT